jgi:nucleoside-diphosphate-sugar epimerase
MCQFRGFRLAGAGAIFSLVRSATPGPLERNLTMTRTALILGATGGFGSEMARALLGRGYRVRAMHRNPEEAAQRFAALGAIEWQKGDAMSALDVVTAARGADVIVHAVNPPGYRNWRGLALPMLESTLAAARASGARIVFPGTVYNFGPDAFPLLDESQVQRPLTRKGAIRVEMEERLKAAAKTGVKVLIVRAGDFFGPRSTGNNWFSAALAKPGRALRSLMYPGDREAGHAWAYLPDLAETFARLLDRDAELQPFEAFHFRGHSFERGVELAEATRRAARNPSAPIRRFPWFAIYLLAPFSETFREMIEMRYLWRETVMLDNAKLVAFLAEEPHTPLEAALHETLRGLDVIPIRALAFESTAPHGQARSRRARRSVMERP